MELDGIHHITCITADAPGERRLLRARAGAAAGQEDRQLRRPGRLPPVLRGRAGRAGIDPDLLRVPRRGARPRRRGDDPPAALAGRLCRRARVLVRAARGRGHRGRARRARPRDRVRGPRGLALELAAVDDRRRAAAGSGARTSPPSTRCSGSTACERTAHRRTASRGSAPDRRDGVRAHGARRVRRFRGRRRATYTYDDPPRGGRVPGRRAPCITSPGATATTSTRAGASASPQLRPAADAGDRPPVLPQHLLPRAERGAVRARHPEPGLRDRRGPRPSRRGAPAATSARAPARAARADADAADSATHARRRPRS